MYIMMAVAFMLLAVICGLCWGGINIGNTEVHTQLEEMNINEIKEQKLDGNKHKKFSLTDSDDENDDNSLEREI